MEQIIIGAANPLQRRAYHEFNGRIQRFVETYQSNNIIDFLRAISDNIVH